MMMHRHIFILALFLPTLAHAAEVKTLSGDTKAGDVTSVTDKEVRLKIDDQETTLSTEQLVGVELLPPGRPLPPTMPFLQLRLMDGTTLKCQAFGLVGKNATARLFSGLSVQFPAASLHWVLCDAHDPQNRQEFNELLAKKPQIDQLRLLSRDGLAINLFEGFVGDADATGRELDFAPEGSAKVKVAVPRVRGILFSKQPDEKAPVAVCKVHDTFENVFAVHTIGTNDDAYRLTTPGGLALDLPKPFTEKFDFSLGKMAYLSDLEPVRLEETPILADLWHYRRDKNLEGEALSLTHEEIKDSRPSRSLKVHAKGLALHSQTVIEYDVRGYNTFRCFLGIDPRVTGPSHVIVRFEADNKALFETPLSGKDAAKDLNLPVTGVSRLRITVDYGEDLDLGDHVILAEARVMR